MTSGNRIGTMLALASILICSATALATEAGVQSTRQLSLPENGETAPSRSVEVHRDQPANRDLCLGWPVTLGTPGAGFPYTPTLADVDHDGDDEIFVNGGHTFALNGDGTFLPGWPTVEMEYMGYGTNGQMPGPSVADLEQDGDVEILWSLRDWYAGSAHMWSFNGKNADGTDLPGFPQDAPDESSNALDSPMVLGDSDGDGNLEGWSAHTLGNNGLYDRFSAFDHLGNRLFTTILGRDENILNLFFGDVDGNGDAEFFAVALLDGTFRLHLFTSSGQAQAGYPVDLFAPGGGYLMPNPPIAADLDDDGDLEIIIGHWGGGSAYAECHHHDGTVYAGFPITVATNSQLFSLGLGDITGDGEPELIAFDNHLSGDYRVWAISLATGNPLFGWPFDLTGWPKGIPTVVDVDNDGLQEVCCVTGGGLLFAIHSNGLPAAGYPLTMAQPSISGVSAGDIDGDGLYELVAATWDGIVYAWNTTGEVLPGRADWPQRGVDARNTGVFYKSAGPTAVAAAPIGFALTTLAGGVDGGARFRLTSPRNESGRVTVFDVRGVRVREIFDGSLAAGSRVLTWDGCDAGGRAVASGVYLVRAVVGDAALSARVAIVR